MMRLLITAAPGSGSSTRSRRVGVARTLLAWSAWLAVLTANAAQPGGDDVYSAAWLVVANPEPIRTSVAEGSSATLLSVRPARASRLERALQPIGKSKPVLAAGTVMVSLVDRPAVACRLDRPEHEYFIECVEDADDDGRFERLFLLNHDNPLLFTARRQPRHRKTVPIEPATLSRLEADAVPKTELVLHFPTRRVMTAAQGVYAFELCVLRADERNVWGDKAQGRGCLPRFVVAAKDFPARIPVPGSRILEIGAPADGRVELTLSAVSEDLPVRL